MPDQARLGRRLARLERNAAILADRLDGFHPGVGPLVQLDVAEPQAWVARALEQAKRRNVQVVAGTSFGFDHTRVYVTAPGPDSFLRIAPGTEDRLRIETVAEALSAAPLGGLGGTSLVVGSSAARRHSVVSSSPPGPTL